MDFLHSCLFPHRGIFLPVLALALLAAFPAAAGPEKANPPLEGPVRLALATNPHSALAIVAVEKGYFKNRGLDVRVEQFVTGKRAVDDGLLAGKSDLASTSDLVAAFSSFSHPDLRILASISENDDIYRIVARTDHGILKPSDLRGKRIATQDKSAMHFFLHLFLLDQGMGKNDTTVSFLKAEQLHGALARGDIDAIATREPYVSEAQELLKDKAVVFAAPGLLLQFDLLAARSEWIKNHPEHLKRFLAALVDAETLVQADPQEGIAILAKWLSAPREKIESLWPSFVFRVALDQSLLLRLEEQASWVVREGYGEGGRKPDSLGMLHLETLNAVDSKRVTVIK